MKNPLREICTAGSVREETFVGAMVDLNGHEAGNGGYSQVKPTALRTLLYSERCSIWHTFLNWPYHGGILPKGSCLLSTLYLVLSA